MKRSALALPRTPRAAMLPGVLALAGLVLAGCDRSPAPETAAPAPAPEALPWPP